MAWHGGIRLKLESHGGHKVFWLRQVCPGREIEFSSLIARLLVERFTDRKDKIKDYKHEPVLLTCLLAGRSTGSLANQPGRSGTVDALTSKPE